MNSAKLDGICFDLKVFSVEIGLNGNVEPNAGLEK